MNGDCEIFIGSRCEKALLENEDYIGMERGSAGDQDKIQAEAEMLCYVQGWKDAMKIFSKL